MTNLVRTLLLGAAAAGLVATAAEAGVRKERVIFQSGGVDLVGDLYLPDEASAARPVEGVVVTGAWTTIKEQMAGRYARELAERGFVSLAFDFRTWGESAGPTRSLENPAMKIEDIESAARFLKNRADVSTVNALGICASAGYAANAAANGAVDRLALVAPWLHDGEIVNAVYGGATGVATLIETGRKAAAREAETGEPQLIPAAGPKESGALMQGPGYYVDPARGLIAEWENTFNIASWEGWLSFDGVAAAPRVRSPLLIVHSKAAAVPEGARRFYAGVSGEKEEIWLDGLTQFDFYDREDAVETSADAVADHFRKK